MSGLGGGRGNPCQRAFFFTSNASIPANSQHACRLSRSTHEASDRTTNARRPADPTERPTHLARRTTARRPSRGARAAASTRVPCERCGAPEQCRRPPERGQGGEGGRQGPVAGQPYDTVRGAWQSCPDARARNTTIWGTGTQHARPPVPSETARAWPLSVSARSPCNPCRMQPRVGRRCQRRAQCPGSSKVPLKGYQPGGSPGH